MVDVGHCSVELYFQENVLVLYDKIETMTMTFSVSRVNVFQFEALV